MIRLSEGRYLFGDKSTQIFVRNKVEVDCVNVASVRCLKVGLTGQLLRWYCILPRLFVCFYFGQILRSHVMVRVGGGWDTLDHFLQKYDECRKVQQPSKSNIYCPFTTDSPSTTDKRSQFKKGHSRSTEDGVLDTANTASLVSAVSGTRKQATGLSDEQGPLLGEGNLQVTKKGREVVYTTTEVIHKAPSKCNLTHHCSKAAEEPMKSDKHESGTDEKLLSSTSSIEDVALTPVISQTVDKPKRSEISHTVLRDRIDSFIQMDEEQKETLFAQNETSEEAVFASTTSSVEDLSLIPVIDQIASGFDGNIKPLTSKEPALAKTPVKGRSKPNPLPSPYKPGPSPVVQRISTSSSACPINRQRATSTHNLASIGTSSKPNLGKFSRSTISLNDPPSAVRTNKPVGSQSNRNAMLNNDKRAKSISNLVPAPSVNTPTRQDVDVSKMSVWERLSANVPRNSTAPKIVSPPASSLKQQHQQQNHPHTQGNRVSNMKRRNSVATPRKVTCLEEQPKVVKAPAPKVTQTRRSSVARMPAEGSRIPRPSKAFTVAEARSKSVGSSLQVKRVSPT
ncbi:unnamed protein product [Hydatigera taeniaeformis]|uniref:GAR domain-containing protein n=1 Tax=Hydatigena taeniaeformis TaxID=6205 RepID=A0A0R3X5C5_HYDTA|nr:unnamed protein product [Hydatigera taeniaeformis]